MDYSLPGTSVHGILQARILEWVAIAFSRESSQPRDQIQVSALQADLVKNLSDSKTSYLTRETVFLLVLFF